MLLNKSIKIMLSAVIMTVGISHAWEIEMSGGRTGESESTFRVGVNKDWDMQFWNSSVGYFSGYWSLGYTYWEKGKYGKDVSSLALSPVLTYNFHTESGIEPFIELGVGIAGFSKTKVGDQNLGSAFSFEDRIGFGAHMGNHTLGARVIHYSNAGIKSPNDGIESYSLYYSYKF